MRWQVYYTVWHNRLSNSRLSVAEKQMVYSGNLFKPLSNVASPQGCDKNSLFRVTRRELPNCVPLYLYPKMQRVRKPNRAPNPAAHSFCLYDRSEALCQQRIGGSVFLKSLNFDNKNPVTPHSVNNRILQCIAVLQTDHLHSARKYRQIGGAYRQAGHHGPVAVACG